jgi:hypothetical protein
MKRYYNKIADEQHDLIQVTSNIKALPFSVVFSSFKEMSECTCNRKKTRLERIATDNGETEFINLVIDFESAQKLDENISNRDEKHVAFVEGGRRVFYFQFTCK